MQELIYNTADTGEVHQPVICTLFHIHCNEYHNQDVGLFLETNLKGTCKISEKYYVASVRIAMLTTVWFLGGMNYGSDKCID
jgi:hypothetical protein